MIVPGGPLRVVVADDEPDLLALISLALRQAEIDVVAEVSDGRAVLDACDEVAPDAVVLDLVMEGMSGFEAVNELSETRPDIVVVAHSANVGDAAKRQLTRLGVPVVLKTGETGELVRVLHELHARRVSDER